MNGIFSKDYSENIGEPKLIKPIQKTVGKITFEASEKVKSAGERFAADIEKNFVTDFEKTETMAAAGEVNEFDKMVHVSTFTVTGGYIYTTYYANTKSKEEDPNYQTARLVYCPETDVNDKTFLDIQSVGDDCYGQRVNMVYDTILAKKDEKNLIILWTAKVGDNYYRLYRNFNIPTRTLGSVGVNRFKVNSVTNDFSTTGIKNALTENGLTYKTMYSDIGIMQKFTSRIENGVTYYYSGAYSGDFTCIIKSTDFITWEYVSEPDFDNESKWENATYVLDDKVFYFVRQHDELTDCGFLTVYDLKTQKWEPPLLVQDCQSRSDFIEYKGNLYLFHAPIDREHIGVIKIDTDDIKKSVPVLQAHMKTSCFYPFIQYFKDGELAMSYTVNRRHIRLARFTLSDYLD